MEYFEYFTTAVRDGLGIDHATLQLQAFHEAAFSGEQAGEQTGAQGLPPQQFSVRKPSNAFIASNCAV